MQTRPFRLSDIGFALTQTAREGWLSSRACLEAIVESQEGGCFLAEEDGRPIGMVTTTRYLQTGWIGNLVVVPDHRRRGLGTELMTRAFGHLKQAGVQTVRLEADPPGVNIYRKLGFEDVCESLRFVLPRAAPDKQAPLEPMGIDHLSELADFDRPRFGDNRIKFLRALQLRSSGAFRLSGPQGLLGYVMLLPTKKGTRIGPLVAVDQPTAERLVKLAVSKCPGQTLSIGIPAVNKAAVELCRSLAFEVRPKSLRMIWGEDQGAGDPDCIFGIASGATG
jgi:GNAT superfamily N-acetyltransferase